MRPSAIATWDQGRGWPRGPDRVSHAVGSRPWPPHSSRPTSVFYVIVGTPLAEARHLLSWSPSREVSISFRILVRVAGVRPSGCNSHGSRTVPVGASSRASSCHRHNRNGDVVPSALTRG